MKTHARFALAFSTLMLLTASATSMAADRVGEVPTKTVGFGDLDLTTAHGAEALYGRLTGAARVVCRGAAPESIHVCRAHAVDDAVKAVGNPLLSAVHRSNVERVDGFVRR